MISTKVGVFEDENVVMHACINHPFEELCRYPNIMDEFDYRKEALVNELKKQNVDMHFDVIVGRGGLVKPIESWQLFREPDPGHRYGEGRLRCPCL